MLIRYVSSYVCSSALLAIQLRCDLHLGRRREVNAAVPCPTDQDAGLAVLAALARPGRPPGRRNGQLGEQLEGALLQFRRQAVDLEKVPLTALAAAPWYLDCEPATPAPGT